MSRQRTKFIREQIFISCSQKIRSRRSRILLLLGLVICSNSPACFSQPPARLQPARPRAAVSSPAAKVRWDERGEDLPFTGPRCDLLSVREGCSYKLAVMQ